MNSTTRNNTSHENVQIDELVPDFDSALIVQVLITKYVSHIFQISAENVSHKVADSSQK